MRPESAIAAEALAADATAGAMANEKIARKRCRRESLAGFDAARRERDNFEVIGFSPNFREC
jgi:hypothetical protein